MINIGTKMGDINGEKASMNYINVNHLVRLYEVSLTLMFIVISINPMKLILYYPSIKRMNLQIVVIVIMIKATKEILHNPNIKKCRNKRRKK